jgi:hypothetical protein
VGEPKFESATALIREPNAIVRWASPAMLAVVVALAIAGGKSALPAFPALVGVVAVASMLIRRWNWAPKTTPGKVTADDEGIRRDGVLVLPRAEIKQGFVVAGSGTWLVRLDRGFARRRTDIAVSSVEEGRALLRALGLDASQTAATVRGMSRMFAVQGWKMVPFVFGMVFAAMLCGFAARTLHNPQFFAAFMPLFMLAFASTMLIPTKIRVGADGILTRWAGAEKFYGYREIERVAQYESGFGTRKYVGVELTLRSGKSVRLPVGQKMLNQEESNLLFERVREAIEVYREGAAGIDASALARSGRETTDWVRALKSLGAGAGADMRTAGVPIESLLGVVTDSAARAIDRASAAVALTPVLGDEDRTRIRVAADAAASPKLRVALEKVSSGADDATLAEALSELEEEEAKREKK